MDNLKIHEELCKELHNIYKKKNHDYGNSFHDTYLEEGFAMSRIRLTDKLNRFKTLSKNDDVMVKNESLEDTLMDLANYAVMTVVEMRLMNQQKKGNVLNTRDMKKHQNEQMEANDRA